MKLGKAFSDQGLKDSKLGYNIEVTLEILYIVTLFHLFKFKTRSGHPILEIPDNIYIITIKL